MNCYRDESPTDERIQNAIQTEQLRRPARGSSIRLGPHVINVARKCAHPSEQGHHSGQPVRRTKHVQQPCVHARSQEGVEAAAGAHRGHSTHTHTHTPPRMAWPPAYLAGGGRRVTVAVPPRAFRDAASDKQQWVVRRRSRLAAARGASGSCPRWPPWQEAARGSGRPAGRLRDRAGQR